MIADAAFILATYTLWRIATEALDRDSYSFTVPSTVAFLVIALLTFDLVLIQLGIRDAGSLISQA